MCQICNSKNETKYYRYDHIDNRKNYIEGVGQLCLDCWEVIQESKLKKEKELTNVS